MSAPNAAPENHEGPPPAFHLLAKPTGAVCNLDCSYCFFLSKEMLYSGSRFRMADQLLEAYLRQLIEAHSRAPEVAIAWQGGSRDAARGRNDPCTCGGGSKWKRCHGTELEAVA